MSANDIEGVRESVETLQRDFRNPVWLPLTAWAENKVKSKYAILWKQDPEKDELTGRTKLTLLEFCQMFWWELSDSFDGPLENSNYIWAQEWEESPTWEEKDINMLVWIEVTEKWKNILETMYTINGRKPPITDASGRFQLPLKFVANIFWKEMADSIESPINMEFSRVKDSEVIVQDISNEIVEEILEEHQWISANDENFGKSYYDENWVFHPVTDVEERISRKAA